MQKYLLVALIAVFLPSQALAGISCRGDHRRGASAYFSSPVGRVSLNSQDLDLARGNYTLDKICKDSGNVALLYMRQDDTRDFYYLVLTSEVMNFINSLPEER